jgi:holo-[acyl-carrier protein] synthase
MAIVGIGTDIVEIVRLKSSLEKSDSLAKRVLNETEFRDFMQLSKLSGVLTRDNQVNTSVAKQCRFLAKRFAAKEAAVKAIGNGIGNGVSWHQIEVAHYETGQPFLKVTGRLKELFEEKGVTGAHLSISDEQNYAVATVILEAG